MQRWINPDKGRYYLVDLVQDLLGDWTLILSWGALGSRGGQMRVMVVASKSAGLEQLETIAKRRRRCGYQLESQGRDLQESQKELTDLETAPQRLT
ncbi:WGR domain-containing protein [Thiorhodococcus mannitoliphagus]|uniref:WGR domain-containing protein n=1 Tax=Thiorhodococcus mannitoliphagus TaxID=329406 RepID=A0A6P1DUG7_9GAMM|nr:WGR domain-containing protein [Thiorhodococcus mannitoliphagus]NEX21110.1 WGR domain-containing protein [Thiorhodococcus mannitoliphagus]